MDGIDNLGRYSNASDIVIVGFFLTSVPDKFDKFELLSLQVMNLVFRVCSGKIKTF